MPYLLFSGHSFKFSIALQKWNYENGLTIRGHGTRGSQGEKIGPPLNGRLASHSFYLRAFTELDWMDSTEKVAQGIDPSEEPSFSHVGEEAMAKCLERRFGTTAPIWNQVLDRRYKAGAETQMDDRFTM